MGSLYEKRELGRTGVTLSKRRRCRSTNAPKVAFCSPRHLILRIPCLSPWGHLRGLWSGPFSQGSHRPSGQVTLRILRRKTNRNKLLFRGLGLCHGVVGP